MARKGLPTEFVIKVGPRAVKYYVCCTKKRPRWTTPHPSDLNGMTDCIHKRIWVYRLKNPAEQFDIFEHELTHAVIEELGIESRIGKLEEDFVGQATSGRCEAIWRLGPRWDIWRLRSQNQMERGK